MARDVYNGKQAEIISKIDLTEGLNEAADNNTSVQDNVFVPAIEDQGLAHKGAAVRSLNIAQKEIAADEREQDYDANPTLNNANALNNDM